MSGIDRDEQQHAAPVDPVVDEAPEQQSKAAPAKTDSQKLPAILLFGMPGTGKGTQGQLLGTMAGLFHISTGEIFRGLDPSTEDGRVVRDLIDHGNLVPDDLAVRLWKQHVAAAIDAGELRLDSDVLILDGIPRSVTQCRLLDSQVDVLAVIHLASANDEPIVERLLQRGVSAGRADDGSEAVIRRRFEIYRQTTAPVLDFYPPEKVHSINPLGTPIEVKKQILECIIPAIRRWQRDLN
ncbi:AAA family ATPase [bacterium]|nr:AAA family ATPase [bacterium]